MKKLDAGSRALMERRVFDVAGMLGEQVSVTLNGKKIKLSGFQDYIHLYKLKDDQTPVSFYKGKRWEVGAMLAPKGQTFTQVCHSRKHG